MQGKYFQFLEQRTENGCSDVSFGIFGHWHFRVQVRERLEGPVVTHWVVNSRECKPKPVAQKIGRAIARLRKGGQKIDCVIVDPDIAGCLYLEGKLSLDTFRSAVEEEDLVVVSVEFGGNTYKVAIRSRTARPFVVLPA